MITSSFAGCNLDEVSTHSRNDTIYTLSEKRFSRLIYVQASNSRDNSHTRWKFGKRWKFTHKIKKKKRWMYSNDLERCLWVLASWELFWKHKIPFLENHGDSKQYRWIYGWNWTHNFTPKLKSTPTSFTFAPSVLSDTMQRVFSGESLNCFLSPPTNESLTYQTLLRSQTEQGKNLAILQSPLILDLKNNIL